MSTQMVYTTIGVWLTIVAAVVGLGLSSGVQMTMGTGALALFVAFIPSAILLKLCCIPELQTAAELLRGRP